ncbi:hypothetical protein BJF78_11450 [Pseudonocardia sp. CNS-139]|nr:hypothetical protein BJF78_11450 [Pseudonocardia sp. CNS-139]
MADEWLARPLRAVDVPTEPRYQSKQIPSLAQRVGEEGVQRIIEAFRSGVTLRQLAEQYDCSQITVQRLLHKRGVFRWRVGTDRRQAG